MTSGQEEWQRPEAVTAPVFVRPGGPPPDWVDLGGRLRWVLFAFAAMVVINLVSIVSGYLEVGVMERIRDDEPISERQVDNNDLRVTLVAAAQLLCLLVVIVAWLRWFHRAYRNVDAISSVSRRYANGWAIGGWFVPILNLWRPKQIANDLWAAGDGQRWQGAQPLLLLWWLGFLASSTLDGVAGEMYWDAEQPEEYITANWWYMGSDLGGALIALLACAVASRITRRMHDRRERLVGAVAE